MVPRDTLVKKTQSEPSSFLYHGRDCQEDRDIQGRRN